VDIDEELFDDAQCGYLVVRPDGSIFKVNRTFLALTGHERDALLSGTTLQQLLTIPGRIYYETHVAPLLQMQGYIKGVAFDMLRPHAEPLSVLLNAAYKKADDSSEATIRIVVFDATERRNYERELLRAKRLADEATQIQSAQREEAERANRSKDEFLALISHELRTPLGVILGWSQVLRKKLPGNADVERAVSVIERNTQAQVRLVDDLLDMGRITSGKLRLDVQRVNLSDVIEAALETAVPAALARDVQLNKLLDPGVVVAGDPGRLQQVFWNLFSNAVKFTPRGGFVRVVMGRVNSHIEVSVIDNGQGMTQEFLGHAFERFRQFDSANTRQTSGLGLGLSLVKYLVEMHGGTIDARSEGEGRGTTFIVRLPVVVVQAVDDDNRQHPTAALSFSPSAADSINLRGIKVVLAEDDRDARELLWHTLVDRGADVIAAGSALEALQAVERIRPDVLISDISMPDGDGYELIHKVRMLGEGASDVPAVALTALARLEDRTRALLAGYQIHLTKPVDVRELIVTVASLAGRLSSPSRRQSSPK
jgi:signal transduction histidine kinase/ActR/RegA family two-component response regulator